MYDLNATYEGGSDESNYQYTILHGSEGKFRIESNTGMVTTTVMLDREFEEQYTV